MNKLSLLLFLILTILFNQIIKLNANDDTYINSSNITYNEKENILELAENSKINFRDTNILIDKGIIDYNKNEFEVFGNFYLYEELTILSGQNLKGNTNLDIFTADNVSYIYNNDLKIDSNKLNRNDNLVNFYNNFLTPCELEGYFNCPTWSLRIDKTEYNIEKDKFTHYDSFLQIADYKVFYLPYFTHYGVKAPRQKGFLTPTIEYTIGGDPGIITPYYFPINDSTDITFKPKIYFTDNLNISNKYDIQTTINKRNASGSTQIELENVKKENNSDINSSIKINTKSVIDKNRVISASGLFTNSISTTRSNNEDPLSFEDIYLRYENYNLRSIDDYLKTELSSVESYNSTGSNSIPISSSVIYHNNSSSKDWNFMNELELNILRRNNSNENPSDSFKINLNNDILKIYIKDDFKSYHKIKFSNSYGNYEYNNEISKNNKSLKSSIIYSSDLFFYNFKNVVPRAAFILPIQLENSNKLVNEDSNSITFNYQNQFADNRFFGNDLFDSSPRFVYGIENNINIFDQYISFNINQSYDFRSNNSYNNLINQNTNFSDYSIVSKAFYKEILFKVDARLDQKNFSKKEMNYSFNINSPLILDISYNETQSDAFKSLSSDTQSIDLSITKKFNENFKLSYQSNLDVKSNYDPYESSLQISLFDECSQLDLTYTNTRFNDNYNTKPKETISLSFRMDYLGFFGYEQSTDLLFKDTGSINYGQ